MEYSCTTPHGSGSSHRELTAAAAAAALRYRPCNLSDGPAYTIWPIPYGLYHMAYTLSLCTLPVHTPCTKPPQGGYKDRRRPRTRPAGAGGR